MKNTAHGVGTSNEYWQLLDHPLLVIKRGKDWMVIADMTSIIRGCVFEDIRDWLIAGALWDEGYMPARVFPTRMDAFAAVEQALTQITPMWQL